jgi:hypothetical protein
VWELESVVEGTISAVDEILERTPSELDHAWALEACIDYLERLDKMLNSAITRRNIALDQLERYRDGYGTYVSRAADEIVVEFKECEAVPKQIETTVAPPAQ